MKKYELLLTIPGTLDDQGVKGEIQKVTEILKTHNSSKLEVKNLGKIRLAYPIKQIRYGYFYTIVFETETKNVLEISKKLKLEEGFLRAIINIYNAKAKEAKLIIGGNQPTAAKTEIKEKFSLEDAFSYKEQPLNATTEEKSASKSKVDLADIDKKLDEILDSTDIVTGV